MPIYRHTCRDCELDWDEDYSLAEFDDYKARGVSLSCPDCKSVDTYRNVTTSKCVIFKGGGVGWCDDGYYNYGAYDKHKAEGKSVKLYDRKEDIDREMRGEAELAEKNRLKKVDAAARRHMSPDAGLTQAEADVKIKAAGQKAIDR
jgi:predicted nucleic acid-binding Zn ribbon protein